MADDDSSELSSLSSLSPVPSDDESDVQLRKEKGILKFFHKVPKSASTAQPAREMSPPARKKERAASPPHEDVLADNQDIAFIVMFRNRFSDAFPKNLANFGPQELERDVADAVPGERVEHFICALLKLLLNRQQDVKPGHYNRALEEAVQTHKSQWIAGWEDSPLAGGKTFAAMNPVERLSLLRALVLWAMSSSKAVRDIIDHAYKGKRQEYDSNIPLSVQPWGSDSDKRRYFLIEGRDDTAFRVYRESNPAGFTRTWWSVAGSIDEVKALIEKLETGDGGPKARKLARKLGEEIPRFEATEEKRRRREYRQMRKEQFKRPEPGFSLYEGRTRGKRMKYTYSDDEDFMTDSTGARRSARNTGTHTPAEPSGPVVTASGRHIRAPNRFSAEARSNGGISASASVEGDATHDGDVEMEEDHDTTAASVGRTGRPRRSAAINHGMTGWASKKKQPKARDEDEFDEDEDEDDEDSEPEFGDDEEDEHVPEDLSEDEEEFEEDEAMLDDDDDQLSEDRKSLVVTIPLGVKLDKQSGKYVKSPTSKRQSSSAVAGTGGSPDEPSTPARSSKSGDSEPAADSPPVKTAEEISVAVKPLTPPEQRAAEPSAAAKQAPPSLPPPGGGGGGGGGMATSLAFRGSPEKAHHATPRPIDVGHGGE